jgi:hypothetical protein
MPKTINAQVSGSGTAAITTTSPCVLLWPKSEM